MEPVIRFSQVSKRFGTIQALDEVPLRVQPGTVCALLGANGAGKSTALRMMLGLEFPDRGDTGSRPCFPKKPGLTVHSQAQNSAIRLIPRITEI